MLETVQVVQEGHVESEHDVVADDDPAHRADNQVSRRSHPMTDMNLRRKRLYVVMFIRMTKRSRRILFYRRDKAARTQPHIIAYENVLGIDDSAWQVDGKMLRLIGEDGHGSCRHRPLRIGHANSQLGHQAAQAPTRQILERHRNVRGSRARYCRAGSARISCAMVRRNRILGRLSGICSPTSWVNSQMRAMGNEFMDSPRAATWLATVADAFDPADSLSSVAIRFKNGRGTIPLGAFDPLRA